MTDREVVNLLIDAWDALPGGRYYRPAEVEEWLRDSMAPAISKARKAIGRERPPETV